MDKNTMLTLARMRDKNKKIEVAEKAENLNLKTQLLGIEGNIGKITNAIDSLSNRALSNEGKLGAIANHLGLDFSKEVVTSRCFDKLDSHLVSYSNDTCSLYPECA